VGLFSFVYPALIVRREKIDAAGSEKEPRGRLLFFMYCSPTHSIYSLIINISFVLIMCCFVVADRRCETTYAFLGSTNAITLNALLAPMSRILPDFARLLVCPRTVCCPRAFRVWSMYSCRIICAGHPSRPRRQKTGPQSGILYERCRPMLLTPRVRVCDPIHTVPPHVYVSDVCLF
jgi:hypothetical protein